MHRIKPDSLIFVLAYLFILSLGAFYGSATILGTTYPAAQQIGMGEMLMLIRAAHPGGAICPQWLAVVGAATGRTRTDNHACSADGRHLRGINSHAAN